ncbi:5-formyltetrahydrofolate cyclo-ligase [soil metagenome]
MDIGDAKRSLRARMAELTAPTPDVHRRVVDQVCSWLVAKRPQVVVGFLGMEGEIDITPLVERLPSVTFTLTRTAPGVLLTIHPFEAPREMHRFGFLQPAADSPILPPRSVDVVLVPGLAFDRQGRRLGRGAGYYDRFLAGLAADKVALTTQSRIVEEVPSEPHDVAVDWIATESGVVPVRSD